MRVIAMATAIAMCTPAPRASAQGVLKSIPEQHVWLAAALGSGSVSGSLATDVSLWYNRGRVALAVQRNSDDGLFGDQRESWALLGGMSGGAGHHQVVGAVGLATVHAFTCSDDGGCRPGIREAALAFAGEAFIHSSAFGVGLDTFGAIGPKRTSYVALGLSVQLGWLGKAP